MADKPQTVKQYFDSKPQNVQDKLEELRSYLLLADPHAQDILKWGKPALVNDGILYVYAAYKKHISLHPTPSVISAFRPRMEDYTLSENTIQFPLDRPLPRDLVLEIARLRVFEKTEQGIGWK